MPSASDKSAPTNAMVMSVRGAAIKRENTSRPDWSVPSQCGGVSFVPVSVPRKSLGHSESAGGGSAISGVADVGS